MFILFQIRLPFTVHRVPKVTVYRQIGKVNFTQVPAAFPFASTKS